VSTDAGLPDRAEVAAVRGPGIRRATGLDRGEESQAAQPAVTIVRQLTALSRAVAHAASLEHILQLAAQQAATLLAADQTILMLVGDDGRAHGRAAHAVDPALMAGLAGARDERLLQRLQEVLTGGADRVFMAVPLIVQGAVTGLLAVARPADAPWTSSDEAILAAVADQSAAPIEIARLSEEVRQARLVADNLRLYEAERAARAELEAERARLAVILEHISAGVVLVEAPSGRVTFANRPAARLLGLPDDASREALGAIVTGPVRPPQDSAEWPLGRALRTGDTITGEDVEYLRPDGTGVTLSVNATPIQDASGEAVGALTTFADVTQRRLVQQHLQRIQQMDAVGRLAGGVAHEANNQMLVVLSAAAFVLRRTDVPPEVRQDVEQIQRAAERTATVTSQLLAFSRRQLTRPEVLAIGAVVADLAPVLRRTLGEACTLDLELASGGLRVRVDRGQIEQVLINLTMNARDAMAAGGHLRLETRPVTLGTALPGAPLAIMAQPGPYVLLTCQDTGEGMGPETLNHLFEPFYTTKAVGKGTGLGLAFVYGAVKKSGGYVWATSEPGRGATFSIYLPVVEDTEVPAQPSAAPGRALPDELVLVVDDEPAVLAMAARALRAEGYEVVEAATGKAALEVAERNAGRVSLLLTDVAMSEISGLELSHRLRSHSPDLPVIFMSGYPGDEQTYQALQGARSAFLLKPFGPETLAQCVRQLLDRARRSASS
jgi:two-component system cell cycle sensor histidine kinase/response regulator CckA